MTVPCKISIVIPAYNAELYIAETIESVIRQTYSEWELIIVNDGSTDRTESKISPFLSDQRIRCHTQPNAGVSVARNTGISLSTGEFIAFLDADDVWEPENLTVKLKVLEEHPEAAWVFSDMYEADHLLENRILAISGRDTDTLNNLLLWEGEVFPGPCSNMVIRRTALDSGIRFDEKLSTAADLDFCIQLSEKYKCRHIKQPLWTYRKLQVSMSRNIRVFEKDCLYIYKKASTNKLFRSSLFRMRCYSNMYLVLAGSWWVDGRNKKRGIYFIILSMLYYPLNLKKLFLKIRTRL